MSEPHLIQLDRRRRCSLAKVGRPEHSFYQATTDDEGYITLVPVTFAHATTGEPLCPTR